MQDRVHIAPIVEGHIHTTGSSQELRDHARILILERQIQGHELQIASNPIRLGKQGPSHGRAQLGQGTESRHRIPVR